MNDSDADTLNHDLGPAEPPAAPKPRTVARRNATLHAVALALLNAGATDIDAAKDARSIAAHVPKHEHHENNEPRHRERVRKALDDLLKRGFLYRTSDGERPRNGGSKRVLYWAPPDRINQAKEL